MKEGFQSWDLSNSDYERDVKKFEKRNSLSKWVDDQLIFPTFFLTFFLTFFSLFSQSIMVCIFNGIYKNIQTNKLLLDVMRRTLPVQTNCLRFQGTNKNRE